MIWLQNLLSEAGKLVCLPDRKVARNRYAGDLIVGSTRRNS